MVSVQKTKLPEHLRVQCMWGEKTLTAVAGQWEGLVLWTVCPLSNQLGGQPVIAFVCWKILSFSHFLLAFYSRSRRSHPGWPSNQAGSLVSSSSPPLGGNHFSSLSRTRWSRRDENRLFQLGRAVESVCFRLPNCCCCSHCPPPRDPPAV